MVRKSKTKGKKIPLSSNNAKFPIKQNIESALSESFNDLKQDCNDFIDSSGKAFSKLKDFSSNSITLLKNGIDGIGNISKVSGSAIQTSLLTLGVISIAAPTLILPIASIAGKAVTLMMSHPLSTISSVMISSASVQDYKNIKETFNSGSELIENSIKSSYFGFKTLYDFSKSLYIASSEAGSKLNNFISKTYETALSKLEEYTTSNSIMVGEESLLDQISTLNTQLADSIEDFNELQSNSFDLLSGLNTVVNVYDCI